jgi:hypothetical protein
VGLPARGSRTANGTCNYVRAQATGCNAMQPWGFLPPLRFECCDGEVEAWAASRFGRRVTDGRTTVCDPPIRPYAICPVTVRQRLSHFIPSPDRIAIPCSRYLRVEQQQRRAGVSWAAWPERMCGFLVQFLFTARCGALYFAAYLFSLPTF